jgi:hypothetical protein
LTDECIYSGPDTFPKDEIVRFTFRNEASVVVWMLLSPGIGQVTSGREVDPNTEVTNMHRFSDTDVLSILCLPGADHSASADQYVRAGLLTIEG